MQFLTDGCRCPSDVHAIEDADVLAPERKRYTVPLQHRDQE
jgi:hypothetical protein